MELLKGPTGGVFLMSEVPLQPGDSLVSLVPNGAFNPDPETETPASEPPKRSDPQPGGGVERPLYSKPLGPSP